MFNVFNQKKYPKIYNLDISTTGSQISSKDLNLIDFFLGIQPNKENLRCTVQTYSDDVSVFIYSENSIIKWHQMNNNMVKLDGKTFISNFKEDIFSLLEISDDEKKNCLTREKLRIKAEVFINDRKADFQTTCITENQVFFEAFSDVNYFKIAWGTTEHINFILVNNG